MMKKKILALAMILALALTGCGGNASAGTNDSTSAADSAAAAEVQESVDSDSAEMTEETICLTIATTANWDGILRGELMEKYCELIREWSDGRIIVKYYTNGALGTDLDMIEAAAAGTLCIINSVPAYQVSQVPEAALLDMPGLFQSIEEYNSFIQSDYFDTIDSYYRKAGLRLLSSRAFTYRQVTSQSALTAPEDFQGLRMRTMENKYQMAFWQSTGALVSPMDFNETRVALMQNMITSQENPISYMYSANLVEVQDYVLLTNHMPMVSNYVMNEERFQELSEEDQNLIIRMLQEMDDELVLLQEEEENEVKQNLQAQGVTILESTPEIQEMIENGREIVLEMLRDDLGERKVNNFLEAAEKYNGKE